MPINSSINNIQEIVMATSDKVASARISTMLRNGVLRKIAPKIYTAAVDDDPKAVIKRNLFYILGQLYPHAVVSHRSAFELKPTDDGDIFLTYTYTMNISLPGIKVHLMAGPVGTDRDSLS